MSGSGNVSAARIRTAQAMGGAGSARTAVKASAPIGSVKINHGTKAWYDTLDRLKDGTTITFEKDHFLETVQSAATTDFFNYTNSDRWFNSRVEGKMSPEEFYKKTGLIRKGNRIYIPKGSKWKASVYKGNGSYDIDISNGKINTAIYPDYADSNVRSLQISVPESGLRKTRRR